eukprot:sb/3463523/
MADQPGQSSTLVRSGGITLLTLFFRLTGIFHALICSEEWCLRIIRMGVTTNEFWNVARYNYLSNDSLGNNQVSSPFSFGWRQNLSDFIEIQLPWLPAPQNYDWTSNSIICTSKTGAILPIANRGICFHNFSRCLCITLYLITPCLPLALCLSVAVSLTFSLSLTLSLSFPLSLYQSHFLSLMSIDHQRNSCDVIQIYSKMISYSALQGPVLHGIGGCISLHLTAATVRIWIRTSYAIQHYNESGKFEEFTLSFWFGYDSWPLTHWQCVMGFSTGVPVGPTPVEDLRDPWNDESLDVWFQTSGKRIRIDFAKEFEIFTTTTLSLGTWNHYTVTFNTNSGGLKIYENGVETVSRDDLASYQILKAGYLVFGQDQDKQADPTSFQINQSCSGRVKDPYFSDRALSSEEVALVYKNQDPPGTNMIDSHVITEYGDIDISYTVCNQVPIRLEYSLEYYPTAVPDNWNIPWNITLLQSPTVPIRLEYSLEYYPTAVPDSPYKIGIFPGIFPYCSPYKIGIFPRTWLQAPTLFSDNLRVLGESSWSCEYGKIPADSSRCEMRRYLTFE